MSDLFIVAVAGLIRREGKILAMRRALTKDSSPGIWETLSGRMEHGEEPLQAVRREILEESGLIVHVHPRPLEAHFAYRSGVPMIILYFVADWVSGEVELSAEHDAFAWLSAEEFAARTPLEPLARGVEQALTMP